MLIKLCHLTELEIIQELSYTQGNTHTYQIHLVQLDFMCGSRIYTNLMVDQ